MLEYQQSNVWISTSTQKGKCKYVPNEATYECVYFLFSKLEPMVELQYVKIYFVTLDISSELERQRTYSEVHEQDKSVLFP